MVARRVVCLVVLAGLVTVGCGKGPNLVSVKGRLTKGDQPCEGVGVNFVSDDPTGQSFIGSTNADGRFEMYSFHGKPGVAPATYSVRINIPIDAPGGGLVPPRLLGNDSPWRITVGDKGLADVPLDMDKDLLQ